MMKFILCDVGGRDVAVNVDKIVAIEEKTFEINGVESEPYTDRVAVRVEGGKTYTYFVGGIGSDVLDRAARAIEAEAAGDR